MSDGFSALGVKPWLLNSLAALQITKPTPIQAEAIPAILAGNDCIGGSKTGSGKTIAFAVPILQRWGQDGFGVYALVLTPTRELAIQLYEQFRAISACANAKICLVMGGESMTAQAIALAKGPHFVIATPGRLADHVKYSGDDTIRGLRRIKFVVLDEADRLLAPGTGSMLPDIEQCFEAISPSSRRQTLLFTATMTDDIHALKDKPSENKNTWKIIEIGIGCLAIPASLKQTYITLPTTQREPHLHVLLNTPENTVRSAIIFCNRTRTANFLHHVMTLLGHKVTALHSKLRQSERADNLARFRAKLVSILVATDVASRGLDIPTVDLVVNYDVPYNPDDYIHRVGRTARAGRAGLSVTFIGQRDVALILAIEARVGEKMVEYSEEKVSIRGRVTKESTLIAVGEAKREAIVRIEEDRDVRGKRQRRKLRITD